MVRALLIAGCATAFLLIGCSSSSSSDPSASAVHVQGEACGKATLGGGVVVGDGLVITNAHIVAGLDEVEITGHDAQREPATASVIAFDPNRDLALLATPIDAPAVALGSAESGTGGTLITVDPDGVLDERPFEVSRSITATGEDIYGETGAHRKALEVALSVTGGESGSGLFDSDGRLVGVVFATSTTDYTVSYAVAPSEIEAFLEEPRSGPVDTGPCI